MGSILLSLGIALLVWASPARGADPSAIDQAKILNNARKSLSIPPNWQLRLTSLAPAPFGDMIQGMLEVRVKDNVRAQPIFISTDSKFYVVGNFYDSAVDMDAVRARAVNTGQAPAKGGGPTAPVTIVEFSDLQCGSCKKAHEAIQQEKILESYGGKVRLVFKHYPWNFHNWAMSAAVATTCADQQDRKYFWKMLDSIFAKQNDITSINFRQNVTDMAKTIGLNTDKFTQCLDDPRMKSKVESDLREGNAVGVTSTPSFLINGRLIGGFSDAASFKEIINSFVNKTP